MPRYGFVSPTKGTKARRLVNLLLRPEGLTSLQAMNLRLAKTPMGLSTLIIRFQCECGFDIRATKIVSKPGETPHNVYRIVGRHRWHGNYRRFVDQQTWLEQLP